jgi:hypothetical protein
MEEILEEMNNLTPVGVTARGKFLRIDSKTIASKQKRATRFINPTGPGDYNLPSIFGEIYNRKYEYIEARTKSQSMAMP